MYSQATVRQAGPAVTDHRSKRLNTNNGYGLRNDGFQTSYSYNDHSGADSHSSPVTPTLANGPSAVDMFGVNSFDTSVSAALTADQMAATSYSHMTNYGNGNTIRPHTASSTTIRPPKASHLSRGYDSAVDLSAMAHLMLGGQPSMPVLGLSDTTSPINSTFPLSPMPLSPQAQSMSSTVHSPLDVYLPPDTPTTVTPQHQLQQSMSPPAVGSPLLSIYLQQNKTTVRPEVEMKMKLSLTLSPTSPSQFRHICFPRELLARPSQLATQPEASTNARHALHLSLHLVSDSAVRTQSGKDRALAHARGSSSFPPRDRDVPVTELPKTSPAHPANGGKMIICRQCQMRERKRYGRKKQVDSERWSYEAQRIILVNENEYKRLTPLQPHPGHGGHASDAGAVPHVVKSVDFKMRILCYNRHQDCLEPDGRAYSGYRVVLTFKDWEGTVLGQCLSDVYHIADDHKDSGGAKFGVQSQGSESAVGVLQAQTLLGSAGGMAGAAMYGQPQLGMMGMDTSGYVQVGGYNGYDTGYWGH